MKKTATSKHKYPFILLCGESGSGKTAVSEELDRLYGWKSIQSYTTRPPRFEGETGHIFVDPKMTIEDIRRKWKNRVGETNYNGHWYWSCEEDCLDSDIYVIDVKGIQYFKEHYHGDRPYKIIYLKVPPCCRKARMLKQGRNPEDVERRMKLDEVEFADVAKLADVTIFNLVKSQSVEDIYRYITTGEKPDEKTFDYWN